MGSKWLDHMRDRLTVFRQDPITKELTEMTLYEETAAEFGGPRQYLLSKWDRPVKDETIFKQLPDYPTFQYDLYGNQIMAVKRWLAVMRQYPYGSILQAPCGQGKTTVGLYVLSLLRAPALVLIHKSDLMEQWKKEIQKFWSPCEIGWVRQNVQRFHGCPITLGMIPSVKSREKELRAQGFFNYFSVVLNDEVHHLPCNTSNHVIKQFPAKVRLGLTATPRRADGLENVFFWRIGPIATRMTGTPVTGKYIQVGWNAPYLRYLRNNMSKAITLLSKDEARNQMIVNQLEAAYDKGRHIVALTDRVAHAKRICDLLRKRLLEHGKIASVALFLGESSEAQRAAAAESRVLIASFGMLSEGTNLPRLDTLFLITPRGDIEQMVGRIQRVCPDKKEPIIVDICDVGMGILTGLARKRKKLYETLEFKKG